jgi:membrane protein YqaA with SNARE-associated domain
LSRLLHAFLHFVFHIGYFGPVLMGVLDSSFLFLPFGNDLLVIALVARHHEGFVFYVLGAACGSTIGVFLLDLAVRKGGNSGVEKMAGRRRFEYLKAKIDKHGLLALTLGTLAPPPFPFTMTVATMSALGYPRSRLLLTVAAGRAGRFAILGLLALKFGRTLLHIARSPVFTWTMGGLTALCVAGSVLSILKWVRRGRGARAPRAEAAA